MSRLLLAVLLTLCLASPSWAAVTYDDISAIASGTTSVTPAYSASTVDGDLLVICIASKYPNSDGTTKIVTPANWTAPSNYVGVGDDNLDTDNDPSTGTGTNDQGATNATILYRVASGGCCNSGTQSVTITSGNSVSSYMLRFTNATGSWDVAAANGGDNSRGANWSAAMGTDPGITTNDMIVACSARSEGSVISAASEALTAASATFGSETERGDNGTSLNDNVGIVASTHAVTGGPATGNATYTFTSATSSSGGTAILRIREANTPTAIPSNQGFLGAIIK